MEKRMKLVGGIFLIAGTCIGGGMLGLPIITAECGLVNAIYLFVFSWALMTITAFYTLEVSLQFPLHTNMITMAKKTFGRLGEIVCWSIYLIFLYALVAAYISSGQDMLVNLSKLLSLKLPMNISAILFVLGFGSIVISGVKQVDRINRFFMIAKLSALSVLVYLLSKHVSVHSFPGAKLITVLPALSVGVTSFGFSIIVPTLRSYFKDDIRLCRLAILIGSLCALGCYIVWDAVIFGVISKDRLMLLLHDKQQVSGLLSVVSHIVAGNIVKVFANFFTIICILTAFMCVSLGLSDYLADGLPLQKTRFPRLIIFMMTFLPPLLAVVYLPSTFIVFLSLAGLCCVFLQALVPALMAWRCRYQLVPACQNSYWVFGGKLLLIITGLSATVALSVVTWQLFF
jgi:tyrosine-specific transport protein